MRSGGTVMSKRYDPTHYTFKAWDTVVRELQAARDRHVTAHGAHNSTVREFDETILRIRHHWEEKDYAS